MILFHYLIQGEKDWTSFNYLYHLQNVNAFETLNVKIYIYDIVSILKTKKYRI